MTNTNMYSAMVIKLQISESDSNMLIGQYWIYAQDQPIRLFESVSEIDKKCYNLGPSG